jgi:diguanylate cyclase (GGDEF)-like protein
MGRTRLLLRGNALVVSGALLVLIGALWLAVGLFHVWDHPVLGWLPVPFSTALAVHACWTVARTKALDEGTRRFWRHFGLASAIFLVGGLANIVDAVGGAQPSQRIGPVSLASYLGVLGVVLWALLRLPSWQRTGSDWTRFGLDTCVVLVTSGAFVWHFSLKDHGTWVAQTGSAGPMLAIVAVGFVSVITFAKVAFAGAGRLDRRALHILAVGSLASTVFGGLTPFLGDYPYLSTSLIAVPLGAFSIQLAAVRQSRSDGPAPQARRSSRNRVAPYIAVAAMGTLLLSTGSASGIDATIMKVTVVVLTFLVMARQIVALRENRRLLGTVDANLSQLRQYQDQLTRQATHDHLTGVANRTLFETHVEDLLAAGTPFHVALLDMDDFKTVNDRHGHHTGDVLLMIVSRRLAVAAADRGMVARLGGDEFVLVLPESDTRAVEAILANVLTILREPQQVNGFPTSSVASIGVTAGRAGDSPEELLRRADVAMYSAKADGGDRRRWFDPAMDELAREAGRLNADLLRALENGEFFLLYQPIVELPGRRLAGVEALLRWRHPDRGPVPPDVFIPLAERSGQIVALGHWVLENACRQAADWQWRYGDHAPAKVSINVSARQLAEPDFVATVEDVISRTGVDRTRLLLEVTETAVLGAGAPLEAVHRLRANGLRVALDDFGTGQSSLSLLLNCPVDVLKVDRSFVSGSAADHAGAVIVENLIGFTNGLNLEAVAEGVETPEQEQRLCAAGYRLAQGYLFGRPMPAHDIEEQLVPTHDHGSLSLDAVPVPFL